MKRARRAIHPLLFAAYPALLLYSLNAVELTPGAIQRGSVQFLSHGPGDPQTPGYASTPSAKRIPQDKLEGIPKIPSLPISYGEAEVILVACSPL